jgi:hypothetical protein
MIRFVRKAFGFLIMWMLICGTVSVLQTPTFDGPPCPKALCPPPPPDCTTFICP